MKQIVLNALLGAALLLSAPLLTSCDDILGEIDNPATPTPETTTPASPSKAVSSISLNKTTLTLGVGENATLTATIAPSDATNKKVIWSSSDESVAKVSDGVISALTVGSTTITAKTEDGGFTASCEVNVYLLVANATVSAIGKLICTSGHIHTYGEDTGCNSLRVAMIAYVGDNAENAPYNHGLAMAMSDVGGWPDLAKWGEPSNLHSFQTLSPYATPEGGLQYKNATHDTDEHLAFKWAFSNNGTEAPANTSGWFLATSWQLNKMINACAGVLGTKGDYRDLRDAFSSRGGTNIATDDNVFKYWTSTEAKIGNALLFNFNDWGVNKGSFVSDSKYGELGVRSCLAF